MAVVTLTSLWSDFQSFLADEGHAPASATTALKAGLIAFLSWEMRGFILAGPAFYAMYQASGPFFRVYLVFCAFAGVALSVAGPWWLARKLTKRNPRRSEGSLSN